MEEHKRKNPWLGLESYKEGEVLYGRDKDIRDLTQCVLNDTDTLLYGKSGIGKSSILNAGILPAARRNGYIPVLVRLSHKGELSYLDQIKEAINKPNTPSIKVHEVVACKDASKESLYEYFHRNTFHTADGERVKLLIIFDQFEEIFTLQGDESIKKRFFAELADLLNDILPANLQQGITAQVDDGQQTIVDSDDDFDNLFDKIDIGDKSDVLNYVNDNEIHLVFTIREDFLSEFEYYSASIPSLKQNRYGLRPINEEQAAQIILRPMPGLIDEAVARLIIEKVTGRTDFELDGAPEIEVDSAVLSLYLNRLYDAKKGKTITSELVEQKGGEIIADFYLDAISNISESTVEYLEDMLLNGKGRRDNITVYDAINDGGATEEELDILCNKKKILRRFNYAGDLRIEYVHDILCPVVKEHKEERIDRKQQEEERLRLEEEKRKIIEEERAKREQMKQEMARARIRNRRRMFLTGILFIVLLAGVFVYYYLTAWSHESYYAQFERINGWPKGVGEELTPEERSRMPLYYKLSHEGQKDYDTDVEVMSSNSKLPRIPRLFGMEVSVNDTDHVALAYLDKLMHIQKIHFEEGESGRLNREIIYGDDKDNSILYYITYFYPETEGLVWAQFLSAKGQAMPVRNNGLDRIKMSWFTSDNKNDKRFGRTTSMLYFDALGVCQPGAGGIYGYQLEYAEDGLSTSIYSMDKYGRPIDAPFNVRIVRRSKDCMETQFAHANAFPDSLATPAKGPNGFWREVDKGYEILYYQSGDTKPSAICHVEKNEKGNTLQRKMEGNYPVTIPAIINYTYAQPMGYRTSEVKLNADGITPFHSPDGIYMWKRQYDQDGELTMDERYSTPNTKVYSRHIVRDANVVRDEIINAKDMHYPYLTRIDSTINKTCSSITFYGKDNKPINVKNNDIQSPYHYVVKEIDNLVEIVKYYCYDEKNNIIIKQPLKTDEYGGVMSYYCKKQWFDEDKNEIAYQILDTDSSIVKSMMFNYQNGQKISRSVMGVDRTPVRCPNWEEEGYAYYKIYFTTDNNNKFVNIDGVNEWNESSIFYDNYDKIYQRVEYGDFKNWKMTKDEKDYFLITNSYKQFVFLEDNNVSSVTIPYLHILSKDSPLYKKGLRDGDRIIRFGSWNWQDPESLLASEWKRIGKEPIEVEVLRYENNDKLQKKLFTFQVGSAESYLAEYHVLALTYKEVQMIESSK